MSTLVRNVVCASTSTALFWPACSLLPAACNPFWVVGLSEILLIATRLAAWTVDWGLMNWSWSCWTVLYSYFYYIEKTGYCKMFSKARTLSSSSFLQKCSQWTPAINWSLRRLSSVSPNPQSIEPWRSSLTNSWIKSVCNDQCLKNTEYFYSEYSYWILFKYSVRNACFVTVFSTEYF